MAKRRILKKDISYIAGDLFTEALVCKMLIPGIDAEKVDKMLTRILNMQENFIRRAHFPDGKENKMLVREYYKKLFADLEEEANSIAEEIEHWRSEKAV